MLEKAERTTEHSDGGISIGCSSDFREWIAIANMRYYGGKCTLARGGFSPATKSTNVMDFCLNYR